MIFCGIDIGTTNTKAVLADSDLRILDHLTIANSSPNTDDGLADIYYNNFCKILGHFYNNGLLRNQKVFCSIASQGGSFILLDRDNRPLTPIHSWTEQAKKETAENIADTLNGKWYYYTTGWNSSCWLPACKIMELREKMGKSFEKVGCFAAIPDYIFSRLGARITTDITNAQMSGICDFKKAEWSSKICDHIGISRDVLPPISDRLRILDEVPTPWGNITLVTGSHDQYATMRAACLETDQTAMLATGTAWVINMLTSSPIYDDSTYLVHPGRDLHEGQFGNIFSLGPPGPIGKNFEDLLYRLDIDQAFLSQIATNCQRASFPCRAIEGTDLGHPDDKITAIQRFMEWTGSRVEYVLEKRKFKSNLNHLLMTGGAVKNSLWPQIIADICNIKVKAIDFPELTAYGAALFALEAATGNTLSESLPDNFETRIYEPQFPVEYQDWYRNHQYPMLENSFSEKH